MVFICLCESLGHILCVFVRALALFAYIVVLTLLVVVSFVVQSIFRSEHILVVMIFCVRLAF